MEFENDVQLKSKELINIVDNVKENMKLFFKLSAEIMLDCNCNALKPALTASVGYSAKAFKNWIKICAHFNLIKINLENIQKLNELTPIEGYKYYRAIPDDILSEDYPILGDSKDENLWICIDNQENTSLKFDFNIDNHHVFLSKEELIKHLGNCTYKDRYVTSFFDMEEYWHTKLLLDPDVSQEELREAKMTLKHILQKKRNQTLS